MLSDVDYIREVGRLPGWARLDEDKIQTHLDEAARRVSEVVGDGYESATDAKKLAACKYAEACFTMHLIIPVLNTFYTQEIVGLQKEIGEIEFLFMNPNDQKVVSDMWLSRANDSLSPYRYTEARRPAVGWFAV